jgi:hypothetical protein
VNVLERVHAFRWRCSASWAANKSRGDRVKAYDFRCLWVPRVMTRHGTPYTGKARHKPLWKSNTWIHDLVDVVRICVLLNNHILCGTCCSIAVVLRCSPLTPSTRLRYCRLVVHYTILSLFFQQRISSLPCLYLTQGPVRLHWLARSGHTMHTSVTYRAQSVIYRS